MAYFSNSGDSAAFDDQCSKCKLFYESCPIALAQILYNYDAANNEVATEILNILIKDDGTCMMFKLLKEVCEISK